MATSIFTKYFKLGMYGGNDVTSYIITWNNTMTEIDTCLHNLDIATNASKDTANQALNKSDANTDLISNLTTNLNTLTTTVAKVQADTSVNSSTLTSMGNTLSAIQQTLTEMSTKVAGLENAINLINKINEVVLWSGNPGVWDGGNITVTNGKLTTYKSFDVYFLPNNGSESESVVRLTPSSFIQGVYAYGGATPKIYNGSRQFAVVDDNTFTIGAYNGYYVDSSNNNVHFLSAMGGDVINKYLVPMKIVGYK